MNTAEFRAAWARNPHGVVQEFQPKGTTAWTTYAYVEVGRWHVMLVLELGVKLGIKEIAYIFDSHDHGSNALKWDDVIPSEYRFSMVDITKLRAARRKAGNNREAAKKLCRDSVAEFVKEMQNFIKRSIVEISIGRFIDDLGMSEGGLRGGGTGLKG